MEFLNISFSCITQTHQLSFELLINRDRNHICNYMFCVMICLTYSYILTPTLHKKQNQVLLLSTVLLLIPTVCCQDVTELVRDKVAIILPPLSDFKHDSQAQSTEPVSSWDPMSESFSATPAQVSKPAHGRRRSYAVKTKL